MDAAIVNRFFKATAKIMSEHFGIAVGTSGAPQIVTPSAVLDDVSVIQSLTGDMEGQFVCGYTAAVALAVARKILSKPYHDGLDSLALSALAELTNMIAGHASTDLAGMGYFCNIAPPLLLQGGGNGAMVQFSTPHLISLPVLSGAGEFRVFIGLKQHLA